MLNVDWFLQYPLDFEYKNYILLDYLQSLDNSYKVHKLSPYLLWTEKLVDELKDFSQKKNKFTSSIQKKAIHLQEGRLFYKSSNIVESKEIKTIIEIVEYSTPILESKVKLGYKLLDKYPQILFL